MWEDFLKRLTSRKFLLCLVGCVGYILLGVAGILPWDQVFDGVKILILAYVGVEGIADIAGRARGS